MKFRTLMISVVLLGCGLPLLGQQAGPAFRTLPSQCLGRPGLPPGVATALCKPALGGAQTPQASNDIVRNDDSGTYTTFDAPGAVNGTFPFAINPAGAITGYYQDANFVGHGFLRAGDGTLTTFAAPGDVNGTYPFAINPAGAITGSSYDANFVGHGFLRTPDGTFTTFDVPGDVNGTYPTSINPKGTITGYYQDSNFVGHGFLRDRDGTITTFDPPGSTFTNPTSINPKGVVSGCYDDSNFVGHGFLRDRDGTINSFDVPGGTNVGCFAFFAPGPSSAMNPAGAITGTYFQPIPGNPLGGNYRGFLRNSDGTFATFDAATYPPCCIWTFGLAINPAGAIAGYQNDGHNLNHGFVRDPDGTITALDVPGAGTGDAQGTVADGINPGGQITGYYTDTRGVTHGWIKECHHHDDCEGGE
jgi:hypothetical protein